MRSPVRSTSLVVATAWGVTLMACARPAPAPSAAAAATTTPAKPPAVEAFVPGLGEFMALQQMRHTKLWFAGQAKNWPLAAYEIEELAEGFGDVIKWHPTHKDAPIAVKDAIPIMMNAPLDDLRQAVTKQDATAFAAAYDTLTTNCNNCHEATNVGFTRIQRPAANPYANQAFDPVKK